MPARLFQKVSHLALLRIFQQKNLHHLPFASSHIVLVKLCRVVYASVIFAAVIFSPVLLWASFPPSDSQSCVWGRGGGREGVEMTVTARVVGEGAAYQSWNF